MIGHTHDEEVANEMKQAMAARRRVVFLPRRPGNLLWRDMFGQFATITPRRRDIRLSTSGTKVRGEV
jgi:hypothetical protein